MPQSSPDTSPTRQVERIREILVGRQLNSVEQRLTRLESSLHPMPVAGPSSSPETAEMLTRLRDDLDAEKLRQMEETRRLAQQIQVISRQRREIADEAREAVIGEMKPGFDRWQEGFMSYLALRENKLRYDVEKSIKDLRAEIQTKPSEPPLGEEVRNALSKLADSARQLCEALNPGSNP